MKLTISNFLKRKESDDRIVTIVKKLCSLFSRHTIALFSEMLEIILKNKQFVTIDNETIKYYADKYLIVVDFSEDTKKYADAKITLYKFYKEDYEWANVCYMDLSKHQKELFSKIIS